MLNITLDCKNGLHKQIQEDEHEGQVEKELEITIPRKIPIGTTHVYTSSPEQDIWSIRLRSWGGGHVEGVVI